MGGRVDPVLHQTLLGLPLRIGFLDDDPDLCFRQIRWLHENLPDRMFCQKVFFAEFLSFQRAYATFSQFQIKEDESYE